MEHFFRHSVEDYRMVDTGLRSSDLENGQFRFARIPSFYK